MPRYAFEPLSPQDNAFLLWESARLPMHTSGLQVFKAGALARPDGGVDIDAIRQLTEANLHLMPSYRQRIEWVPPARLGALGPFGQPEAVWVDDPQFNLDYHLRHTALPRPGSDRQLKRLASRIMEQPLDRSRPLWETWVVEGLSGGRFALISKTHHCMLDGGSGSDLMQALLSPSPTGELRPSPRFVPRPLPRANELQRDAWERRLRAPFDAGREMFEFFRETPELGSELARRARALGDMARFYAQPTSDSPLNGEVGPHRVFETRVMPLDGLRAIRRSIECSLNDVVLGIVTSAVRRFLVERRVDPRKLEFRVSTPVNVRAAGERGDFGNRVSSWIVRLPIEQSGALEQVARIHEQTQRYKQGAHAVAIEMMNGLAAWLPIDTQGAAARTANSIVTNVPGPPFPLYMLGAEMLELYPQPPLLQNQGLVIGVLSYNGKLCWGLNADYDRVPDLEALAEHLDRGLWELAEAAGVSISKLGERAELARRTAPKEQGSRKLPSLPDAPSALSPAGEGEAPARDDVAVALAAIFEEMCQQHREIELLLDEVDAAAERLAGGELGAVDALRRAALDMHAELSQHLAFEDTNLVPLLVQQGPWGPERARHLCREHEEQRELLEFMLGRIEDRRAPARLLARQLRSFIDGIRIDIDQEEAHLMQHEDEKPHAIRADGPTTTAHESHGARSMNEMQAPAVPDGGVAERRPASVLVPPSSPTNPAK